MLSHRPRGRVVRHLDWGGRRRRRTTRRSRLPCG